MRFYHFIIIFFLGSCLNNASDQLQEFPRNSVIFSAGKHQGDISLFRIKEHCQAAYQKLNASYKRARKVPFLSSNESSIKNINAVADYPVISAMNNGVTIASKWSDLWNGEILAPISKEANTGILWWNGSDKSGDLKNTRSCKTGNWNDLSGIGGAGNLRKIDTHWLEYTEFSCGQEAQFLCLTY